MIRVPENQGPASTAPAPKVTVVVVTYQSAQEISACLDSILQQPVAAEILAVDNASSDSTGDILRRYHKRYPAVRVLLNDTNLGLAAGNNCARGRARGEYLLFLNPDTTLGQETLAQMVAFLDARPEYAVVGPLNRFADGTPHSTFSSSWGLRQIFAWRVLPYALPRHLSDRFTRYRFREPAFVSGACLLIRRAIFEQIGGYDPAFFLAIEDVADLCLRTRQAGWRVAFLPCAEVVHLGGRSGRQATFIVLWEGNRGSIYFCLKHYGRYAALACTAMLAANAAARCAIAALLTAFRPSYRAKVTRHARLFRMLLTENPGRRPRISGEPPG